MDDNLTHQIAKELIESLRDEIDVIDQQIIELVRMRTEKASQVARLKRKNKIPIIDGKRECVIFRRYIAPLGEMGRSIAQALLSKSKNPSSPKDFE